MGAVNQHDKSNIKNLRIFKYNFKYLQLHQQKIIISRFLGDKPIATDLARIFAIGQKPAFINLLPLMVKVAEAVLPHMNHKQSSI